MDVSAVVLNKLLSTNDLDSWGKIKLAYIDPAYTSIYAAIKKHYQEYHKLPSFDELDITQREGTTRTALASIKLTEAPDISIDVAIDALVDQFAQNEAIKALDKYLDKLTVFSAAEVKEQLSLIVLKLDEKTHTTENVYTMDNIMLFKRPEDLARERTYLGLNNSADAAMGGVARQELILIGGKRGSGKSIVSSNLITNQYEMGNSTAYFSIEMVAHETLERKLAILSGVSYQRLKQGKLTDDELTTVVRTRAGMFVDSEEVVQDYLRHKDRFKFEEALVHSKKLKEDNQIIIIDDRALTVPALDLHLGKLKAKFGDKLKLAVIDYINQMVIEGGGSQYDWQPQVEISKQLKDLARKHDVVLVSPYQIDATGEARFAKGILDAGDIAMILEAHENSITFNTTKIRSGPAMTFTSGMDWECLRINPVSVEPPAKPENKVGASEKKANKHKVPENGDDLPWN